MVAGEVSAELQRAITDHINLCANCRTDYEELKQEQELLLSADVPGLSPYFVTRTIARVQELARKKREAGSWLRLHWLWRFAAGLVVAIGLAVGIVIGTGLGSNGGTSADLAVLNTIPSIEELFAGGE